MRAYEQCHPCIRGAMEMIFNTYNLWWNMKNEEWKISKKTKLKYINKKSKTMNFYEFSKRKQKMQKQNITSKYEKQGNHPS